MTCHICGSATMTLCNTHTHTDRLDNHFHDFTNLYWYTHMHSYTHIHKHSHTYEHTHTSLSVQGQCRELNPIPLMWKYHYHCLLLFLWLWGKQNHRQQQHVMRNLKFWEMITKLWSIYKMVNMLLWWWKHNPLFSVWYNTWQENKGNVSSFRFFFF